MINDDDSSPAHGQASGVSESWWSTMHRMYGSDLGMPDKGGYWLIGQVRALPPGRGGTTPAAALTAYVGPEHRASVLRAGFPYHVEKPVGGRELIGVVAMLALDEPVG
ncbi:MAG: hypothetical protein HY294_07680 [Candidatus Rokubacteria bacterium]|nr:hypothetical protein [Candidatus Rokubacteria bacterium]